MGEEYSVEEIRQKIARGLASLDRGEGIDGEEFLDPLQAGLDAADQPRKVG